MEFWNSLVDNINSPDISLAGAVFRLVLSMILGAVVGYERKRRGQSAGVRTFSLISMGACMAMIISIYLPQEYLGLKNGDPGRIAAQVVSGVGFLGAGAIIQMKGSVKGLTTAAGIWMVAIIGIAVGVGMYLLSIIACVLIWFILVQFERYEHKLSRGTESRIIRLKVSEIINDVNDYRSILAKNGAVLNNYYIDYDFDNSETRLNLVALMREDTNIVEMIEQMRGIHPTSSISIANQLSI